MSNYKITKTNDGYVVEIFAKTKKEIGKEILDTAEGVSILDIDKNKTEEEQYLIYKDIAEKMEYSPVVIRICEREKDVTNLKTQLRATLRAATSGDISIVFSMIPSVNELKEYKQILEECKTELKIANEPYKNHIKIGVMIEIPSAALMSYELARECDFLFIETNNLFNFTFGKKINSSQTTEEQRKALPAIKKLIQQAVEGAHDSGIYCGICGDIVENELYIPLLIGLGIDEFSVETKNIIKIRERINQLDKYDCRELIEEVIILRNGEEIEKKLK